MSDYEEMLGRAHAVLPSLWPEMLPEVSELTARFIAPIMVAFAKMEIARAHYEDQPKP
jgi:hypothetical protein